MFGDDLKRKGWTEITALWEYVKGDWKIDFDTGHWMIVSTRNNPRVFDVSAPREFESAWTVNLIEHLCRIDDERHRLREILEKIRDNPASDVEARSAAADGLEKCYHAWLVNLAVSEGQMGRVYCSVCGRTGPSEVRAGPDP
jgi:hypothetical protein